MESVGCVPADQLRQFVLGNLDVDSLDVVAEHVDQCLSCQETIVGLAEQSDTFVEGIRGEKVSDPYEAESACREGVIRALVSLRRPARTSRDSGMAAPSQLGPYEIVEPLGTGGMGTVFKAVHTRLKRTVALKVLPADRWASAQAVSRFQREMQAIGILDHPHIVHASDAGEESGMHYLVMEYVNGLDLAELVDRVGPLRVAEASELIRQAALGLQYIHDQGLVHRDVKPSNLMLAESNAHAHRDGRGISSDRTAQHDGQSAGVQPTVKILDLGLALLGDEHAEEAYELTTIGQLMGTLDYMSPEQGADSHDVDQRADIYSLGATMFKLLTGRAPFAGPKYNTLLKKVSALATGPAPSVASVRPDLPAELVQIVDRMLSKNPDDRFVSPSEVADVLAPFSNLADLSDLLSRARALKSRINTAPNSIPPTAAGQQHAASSVENGHAALSGGRPLADRPLALRPRRRLPTRVAVGGAAFLCVLAAFVIYVATDTATLTIRSSDPDIEVVVKRGDRVVKNTELEKGEDTFTVRSGSYSIELRGGNADQLTVDPDRFTLSRGDENVVTIEHIAADRISAEVHHQRIEQSRQLQGVGNRVRSPKASRSTQQANSVLKRARQQQDDGFGTKRQPRYDGRSYEDWLDELETERKEERLTEAMRAFTALGTDDQNEDAARAIFRVMRRHSMQQSGRPEGAREQLIAHARLALWSMPMNVLVQAMIDEIATGNQNSREFISLLIVPVFYGKDTDHSSEFSALKPAFKQALRERLNDMIMPVLALSRKESKPTRRWAVAFMINLRQFTEVDVTDVPPFLDRLREDLSHSDYDHVLVASGALIGVQDELDEQVVPALIRIISDDKGQQNYIEAIRQLGQIGPAAAPAVPRLVAMLEDYLSSWSGDESATKTTFGHSIIGPEGNLVGSPGFRMPVGFGGGGWPGVGGLFDIGQQLVVTLGQIGPVAKEAVPVLQRVLQNTSKGMAMHVFAERALADIQPSSN